MQAEKNDGIELLRIVAMCMIITLHILGIGGTMDSVHFGTANHALLSLVRSIAVCGVNCFVLISGYFLVDKPFKSQRIVKTVLAVMTYSILLSAICMLTRRETITPRNILNTIIPIPFQGTYWFVTQYISLLFLAPVMNCLIRHLSRKQHLLTVIILLFLFSHNNLVI